ncbi:MAG: subclass B1 metallo-beta-lactamase [Lewinellaceae bacterium]|nr:subclass B1 metallo-beta-lactamase [Lewinellaceae bacterium]
MFRKFCFSLMWIFAVHAGFSQKMNLKVTPIDSQFLVHTSYKMLDGHLIPANGLIVNTPEGVLLVDATWDDRQAKQLLRWIKKHLKRKVFMCIITHSHADRIGGIAYLKKKKIDVESTPAIARRAVADGFPSPAAGFNNDVKFGIGSQVDVRVFFPGQGHSPDNIVVWFSKQRVLFGGCLIKSTEATDLGNIAEANLEEWSRTIRYLMEECRDPRWVIPGHFGWDKPGALEHTVKLLEEHGK